MPFGLTNVPAISQRSKDVLLTGLTWMFCLVHIDDVLKFLKLAQEHLVHLRKTFQHVKQEHKCFKVSKHKLGQNESKFLGRLASKWASKPYPEKIFSSRECLCSHYKEACVPIFRPCFVLTSIFTTFYWNGPTVMRFGWQRFALCLDRTRAMCIQSTKGIFDLKRHYWPSQI